MNLETANLVGIILHITIHGYIQVYYMAMVKMGITISTTINSENYNIRNSFRTSSKAKY